MSQYNNIPYIRHRRSIRLRQYDYSREGSYFVTLCSHHRLPLFGQIVGGKMQLNNIGLIIQKCWNDIPLHFPDVVLREFIIMPNHIHGIINIVKSHTRTNNACHVTIQPPHVGARFIAPNCPMPENVISPAHHTSENIIAPNPHASPQNMRSTDCAVVWENKGAINRAPTRKVGGFSGMKNPMLRTDLARVIRWYKGRTTFECRETRNLRIWQRNYYEHIIRNPRDYFHIAKYINANPVEWRKDRFYNVEID
jgi:REP element-mobilizing transposase RayT